MNAGQEIPKKKNKERRKKARRTVRAVATVHFMYHKQPVSLTPKVGRSHETVEEIG